LIRSHVPAGFSSALPGNGLSCCRIPGRRRGRISIAFDGNIHSIAGDYWFDPATNRTVGVDTAIMLEALKTVYGADHLVKELTVVD
jgi:hypothetical protein